MIHIRQIDMEKNSKIIQELHGQANSKQHTQRHKPIRLNIHQMMSKKWYQQNIPPSLLSSFSQFSSNSLFLFPTGLKYASREYQWN